MLAVKVLQEQELEVVGVTFVTPFFGPQQGLDAGRILGIPVRVRDMSVKHLEMLKRPVYGYGSQANPCIDCHALMLQEAGRLMDEEGGDFLFTGEVLGQRPMSQRRDSLRSVEKLSGYPGRVLRPLSAKLLPPTIMEQEGLVERAHLLDIHGRTRKRQQALAKHYGIHQYPQPGGGCLLTKEGFARKLKALFLAFPEATPRHVEFIKLGRFFRMPGGRHLSSGSKSVGQRKIRKPCRRGGCTLPRPGFSGPHGVGDRFSYFGKGPFRGGRARPVL